METKDILLQYGTHFDAIKKIGGYPLTNSLQLSDLGKIKEMKAISQKCYKGIKAIKEFMGADFKITVIDYVCRVSTSFLLYVISKESKIPREEMTPEDYAYEIVKCFFSYPEETKNLLRLFMKRPSFLLNQIGNLKSTLRGMEANHDSDMKCFQIIGGLWFVIVRMEIYDELYDGSIKMGFEPGVRSSEAYWEYETTKGFISKIIKGESI